MVTKSFICPNGHRWWHSDHGTQCPECGAEAAETVGNGDPVVGSAGAGKTGSGDTTPEEAKLSKFGRYRLIEELGRGGMGIVYRAFDSGQGHEVALKTLPTAEPALLSRFKREFRVLADVDHPNVVKLFELTSDGETWFFTMEIIDGVDLLTYIEHGWSPPPTEALVQAARESDPTVTEVLVPFELADEKKQRLCDGFAQLAEAIASLHASGIVHRDLKPSNVVVTKEGRVVLLDFGLVAETDPSGSHRSVHQQVMGTAAYMSPEQAACETVTAASDWYSVGVMLYQAMTGELPFAGKTLDILVRKQQQDPLPPRKLSPTVPEDWNNLCMNLLHRSPEKRPAAEDVWRSLGGQTQRITAAASPEPDEVILVGRESELQSFQDTWQQVRRGEAKCIFVEGGSGTGKSALVEAFLQQASSDAPVVLKGRCYEIESVPFKAIDSLIDSLVSHLRHLSQADAAALMPRDIHALSSLFPVVTQVEAVASLPRRQADVSDQQELNRRAIGALRELLARMGDRYPLIVYIDGIQWGDEDSAAMLSDLLQPPDPPVLLFLGTYRSEDSETSQFLQSFRQIQRQRESPLNSLQIRLEPLEHADAIELALALLGRNDADAQQSAESIAEEAAGNPFFVSELVKHLQLEGGRVSRPSESSGLADMIWSRVQGLPEESQRLLAIVALWGQPLPLDHAMHVANVGYAAVGPLRTGNLIRTVGLTSSSRIETYHDRIRESVSQCLGHITKQQFHLCIAEEYVRQSPLQAGDIMDRLHKYFTDGPVQLGDYVDIASHWYDVALHFDAAGRPALALPYALASAEKARMQFSLEAAEQQYRIAERGVGNQDEAVQFRVAEGLGDVLVLRGSYDEARVRFDRALQLATGSGAAIEAKLGELAFKQGDMERAIEISEHVLGRLGHKVPRRSLAILFGMARETLVQVFHSVLPGVFVSRKRLEEAESQLLVVRLYNRLTYAYFFERGKSICLWSHLRGMNLAERYPPTLELAHVYASHAPVMGLIAFFNRGVAYAQRSLAIYSTLGNLWGQGLALSFHGIVLYAASRFEECMEMSGQAVKVLERTGDPWELNAARVHVAFSLFRVGDLSACAELARRIHHSGVELGDSKASGYSLDVWAWSTGGQVPVGILQVELKRPREDVQVSAQVLMAEGVRLFMLDRMDEAVEVFEKGHSLVEEAGLRNSYVLPLRSWLASALRRQVETTPQSEPKHRTALLRRAGKVAKTALRVARKFQNDLPHALREAGLISALQGSNRRARKYLDESIEVAERQGARFERAQTLLARGCVGQTLDWPGASDEAAEAREALIEMGAEFALAQLEGPEPLR